MIKAAWYIARELKSRLAQEKQEPTPTVKPEDMLRPGEDRLKGACARCVHAGPEFNFNDRLCKRNAPVVEFVEAWKGVQGVISRWPTVKGDDWCSEFEQK